MPKIRKEYAPTHAELLELGFQKVQLQENIISFIRYETNIEITYIALTNTLEVYNTESNHYLILKPLDKSKYKSCIDAIVAAIQDY